MPRVLAVHGGAGALAAAERAERARRACEAALERGWDVLAAGGSALDAVVRAVTCLEDDPSLNAGYGACLTDAGTVELDASIMEGTERKAGAVAMVARVRNPILLARALLERGPHAFMAGAAAEELACLHGLELVDADALVTPERREQWKERANPARPAAADERGTVGAVALDDRGRVAAATSTGGTAWKHPGRIGDSAVIGAGTFADDRGGAASSTGLGEAIMRATLARAAVDYLRLGLDPADAGRRALAEVSAVGGTAGIIIVDRFGRLAGVHTTPHMTWASRQG